MATGRRAAKAPVAEERAAAALTGGGPSQLGVDASMRARDVSRPHPAHLVEAEQLVQVSFRPRSQARPPLGRPHHDSGQNSPGQGRAGGSPEAS